MVLSGALDLLLGKRLPSGAERGEKITAGMGVPVFGLDALSSAAYGPEAALTILIAVGLLGDRYILLLSLAIIALLLIVFFSYRQTIAAYPSGGGSYLVARANLGDHAGVMAAAALVIDYVLNVAVGISAGVGALVSAVPRLQPHVLPLCLVILAVIMLFNLRGLREAGLAFIVPTYLFVGMLLATIGWGLVRAAMSGGHPQPLAALPPAATTAAAGGLGFWLLLRAFASGCTALTGVEAVSNGVQAFREPVVPNAQRALTIIVVVLAVLLGGIAWLVRVYGIVATPPGGAGYQSVLSMLTAAVAGRGLFYGITMAAVLAVLCLSANTSFADFPRVCHILAEDDFLPHFFGITGRRLTFSPGILVLFVLSGILLWVFGGITDRLIPLFAIGAFLAFTLSQAGMVRHWQRQTKQHRGHLLINGVGAMATGITVIIVAVAKFTEGAWITVLVIPLLVWAMFAVRRHYRRTARLLAAHHPLSLQGLQPPLVVLPVHSWNRVSDRALRFAYSISHDIYVVHLSGEGVSSTSPGSFQADFAKMATGAARAANLPEPKLTVLPSPYRLVVGPIRDYVKQVAEQHPDRQITVVIPEMVPRRWYAFALHNQLATGLKAILLLQGDRRITVLSVPWYLDG